MTGEGREPQTIPPADRAISLPPSLAGIPVTPLQPEVQVFVWLPTAKHGWQRYVGRATAYTARAGHVVYYDDKGRVDTAWVWAGAITRRMS